MKHHLKYGLLALIFLLGVVASTAQEVNTEGRDFWVSFLPNFGETVPKLEIFVASQTPCSGRATNPLTGWSTTFTVTPGVVTSVLVPNEEGLMNKSKANSVEHKAIHVTTTEDVSLYASNYFDHSFDVANVLPTSILKDNYLVQSYDAGYRTINDECSRMLVLATENNTEIVIDPQGGLRGVLTPFSTHNITLNAGECYMCISARGDISGTTVRSKHGKKIAVFSGGDTQIPADGQAYDAVFEQSLPVAYWGRHFVVTATAMRDNDMVRITALSSGCIISIDGRPRKTLGARKSYDFKLNSKKKEVVYISASSPVCVCLYLTSYTMGGPNGDPSMVNINPIEQQMNKVTFASFKTLRSEYHFVNVVTQTSQVGGMTLDGVSIADEFKVVPYKQDMSYARVEVQHGSHTLESKEGGFVAHIYGLGPYESYAYSVGSSSNVLNQFDEQGNLIFSSIPDDDDEDNVDTLDIGGGTDKPYLHTDTLPAVEFGGLTISQLKNGGEVKGIIEDANDTIIDPEIFDITVESEVWYLFEDIDVSIEGDTIVLGFHTRGKWCDCFVPKRLRVDVILTPTDGEGDINRIFIPTVVPIAKDRPWIVRCFWVVVALIVLLFVFFYLLALLKKRRFKKDAMINPIYYDRYGDEVDNHSGTPLREEGLWAWLKRWFWPRDERHTLSFNSPNMSVTFVAADSDSTVNIDKSDINAQTMSVDGYDPNNDRSESRFVKMGNNGRISITKSDGITPDGYVCYSSGDERDGGLYRLVLSIVLIADVLAMIGLVVLVIKGMF